MPLSFFPSVDPVVISALLLIFLFSGIIKGFLGIGLPTAAMAFLTLVMEPTEAISLLTIPIIVTNYFQFIRSSERVQTAKKYKYFALAIMVSIFITAWNITAFPTGFLTVVIGFAMIIFSANLLFGFSLPIGPGLSWQIGVGVLSGFLGGLSSIWSPPVAMYLLKIRRRNSSLLRPAFVSCWLFSSGTWSFICREFTPVTAVKSLMGLLSFCSGFGLVSCCVAGCHRNFS